MSVPRPPQSRLIAVAAVLSAAALVVTWRGVGIVAMEKAPDPTSRAAGPVPAPPRAPATRVEEVVDTVHGVRIADAYRWLEDGTSEEVAAWTGAQNAYTRSLLDPRPGRAALRDRLATLMSIGTVGPPA